jgi:PadR family transcriptional regulator PadR
VEGRPRRRLYELTGAGAQAAELALADKPVARRPRIASEPA